MEYKALYLSSNNRNTNNLTVTFSVWIKMDLLAFFIVIFFQKNPENIS